MYTVCILLVTTNSYTLTSDGLCLTVMVSTGRHFNSYDPGLLQQDEEHLLIRRFILYFTQYSCSYFPSSLPISLLC